MLDENGAWTRQNEAFWRAHHEAWKRSDLNQRQYCEAEGIPLKAFGNWRAQFKAEPQPPERKLLYRRRGLSHSLSHTTSHTLSPSLSHMTYPSSRQERPIVPRPREGHRRRFGEADKRGFSMRRRDPAPASQKWRAAMASIAGFCADGSRS
jgi:hypothetical protein